jgi:hypothetical protein
MIEFSTWVEQQHPAEEETVNLESMLAAAYRQVAEVGDIFGENAEVSARVNTILKTLEELKSLTEAEDRPYGTRGSEEKDAKPKPAPEPKRPEARGYEGGGALRRPYGGRGLGGRGR